MVFHENFQITPRKKRFKNFFCSSGWKRKFIKNKTSVNDNSSSQLLCDSIASLSLLLTSELSEGKKQKGEKSIKVLIKSSSQMSQKKLLSENILLTKKNIEKKSFHGWWPTINVENANIIFSTHFSRDLWNLLFCRVEKLFNEKFELKIFDGNFFEEN